MSTSQKKTALDAAQVIVAELSGLPPEDQKLALRFAAEVLHLPVASVSKPAMPEPGAPAAPLASNKTPTAQSSSTDIRAFTEEKKPQSDQQFAALVAYYYQFIAAPEDHRETIDPEVMKEAARQAGRPQVKRWAMTLTNAKNAGYLDPAGSGKYKLNAVGENLIAISLPDSSPRNAPKKAKKAKKASKKGAKKAANKVSKPQSRSTAKRKVQKETRRPPRS